jgi:ribonuclease HI
MSCHIFTDASIRTWMGIGIYAPRIGTFSYRLRGIIDINRAELGAIYCSIKYGPQDVPIHIYTDSQNAIGMLYNTINIHSKYTTLVECVQMHLNERKESVVFHKVKGHSGNYGNEIADALAKYGTKSKYILKLPDDKNFYPFNK